MNAQGEVRGGADIGRLLAAAVGYEVRAREGRRIGVLDHVRYGQHVDRPDQLIVRRGRFRLGRLFVSFEAVQAVKPGERIVILSLDSRDIKMIDATGRLVARDQVAQVEGRAAEG